MEAYLKMLESQKWVCAICEQPEQSKAPESGETRELAIDHCHETNLVRGLLCSSCNRALGLFQDREDLLRKAAAYLKQHSLV